jgi:methyl-accepting chemotaxis protein
MTQLFNKVNLGTKLIIIFLAAIIPVFVWVTLSFVVPSFMKPWYGVLSIVVSIVLSGMAITMIRKTFTEEIRVIVEEMNEVAKGDLTRGLALKGKDEFVRIGDGFDALRKRFLETMNYFAQGSQVVTGTSFGLEQSAKEMTNGVDQVTMQMNSVAAASEEMASTSTEIARNCEIAAKSSEKANTSAEAGERVIQQTVEVMNRISVIVKESAGIIEGLGSRSDEIGQIVNLIDDIADQTNLLALNAAIEAARAGEHGRGFAVVADEVRKLAERTSSATKEIGNTIRAMQTEARQAVQSTERGVKEVELGTNEAIKLGETFKTTLKQINEVSGEISQIAVASTQQTATVDEIANTISQISSVMSQTSKAAGENSHTASELAALFAQMNMAIGQYKITTTDDAEDLAKEAAAFVKTNGRQKGLEEICKLNGRFTRNGIYVTAHDITGTFLASPTNHHLIGQNHAHMKDVNGKQFNQEANELAKKGGGWLEYVWMNPATKKQQSKVSRVERVEGTDMYILCGFFK